MGFCGLLQRKRFAMTKKIKALRNDFSFSITARSDNDEGIHKKETLHAAQSDRNRIGGGLLRQLKLTRNNRKK